MLFCTADAFVPQALVNGTYLDGQNVGLAFEGTNGFSECESEGSFGAATCQSGTFSWSATPSSYYIYNLIHATTGNASAPPSSASLTLAQPPAGVTEWGLLLVLTHNYTSLLAHIDVPPTTWLLA
jgi:hypothetical protein